MCLRKPEGSSAPRHSPVGLLLCLTAPSSTPLWVMNCLPRPRVKTNMPPGHGNRVVYNIPQRAPCDEEPCPPRGRKPAGFLGRVAQPSPPHPPQDQSIRGGKRVAGWAKGRRDVPHFLKVFLQSWTAQQLF